MLSDIALCIMPFFAVWCFYAGYKVGKKEKIPAPKVEAPIKKWEARKKTKDQQAQQDRLNTLMKNIERYQGNGEGQTKL